MVILGILFLMFVCAGLYALRILFAKGREISFEHRFMIAAAPLLVCLMFSLLVYSVIRMPGRDWNAARITPSVALKFGYTLYYPANQGPILNTLYAPITAVAYLPAALGNDPTSAILIAGAINTGSMAFAMLFLLLALKGPEQNTLNRSLRWALWVLGVAAIYSHAGISYAIQSIHADAPAMGMMLVACTLLMLAGDKPSFRRLTVAALLAACAGFSKQIEVFCLPGIFFYLGFVFGWRSAFTFAGLVAAWAGVCVVVCSAVFGGFEAMMFNIVEVPSLHAWKGPKVAILIKSFIKLMLGGGFILLPLALFVVRAFDRCKISVAGVGGVLNQNRWLLLIFAGGTMTIGSVLGEVKIGGMENSYHTLYYLIAGLVVAIWQWVNSTTDGEQRAATIGIFVVAALLMGSHLEPLVNLTRARKIWDNPQQHAYEFAKKHPGEAVFPWNPLSTLYADGKLYHFEYGIYDRVFSDFHPTDEHFRKHLPANLKYIIHKASRECFQMTQKLPEFSKEVNIPSLDAPLDVPIVWPKRDPLEPPELNEPPVAGWIVHSKP
jgi:uncharacterized membrane protein YuzA (DUF378 family)